MEPGLVTGWSAALYGVRLAPEEAARISAAAEALTGLVEAQSDAARARHGADVFLATLPGAAEAALRAALEDRGDG